MPTETITISGMRGDAAAQVWETCVGNNGTPEKFIEGYETVQDAIDDYVAQYPAIWGQEPPTFYWREMNSEYTMAEMLERYISDRLEE